VPYKDYLKEFMKGNFIFKILVKLVTNTLPKNVTKYIIFSYKNYSIFYSLINVLKILVNIFQIYM
jgi:hypothetical protein